eukprot:NODE_2624_length_1154_cov_67.771041_g2402_i0.p1 GENE.NODE_2624_length_1154_cov_67.771041_g2402_i0~~NODE_2624_length_1154_cov_67.771041_g2402_i0.p1  ORF type:complete len:348 (-),score=62.02 NODE_2624_length_1154_cov_67.771041_g2402_i0:109-1032(-)
MNHQSIDAQSFYAEYHGHQLHQLATLHDHLRGAGKKIVWLAGDSSLDNKHWLFTNPSKPIDARSPGTNQYTAAAENGFEQILRPARCVKDVCYWTNHYLAAAGSPYACINAAVEESTLGERKSRLLAHDEFIRDHLQPDDVVIVSVGGNDIALRPSVITGISVAAMTLTPLFCIERDWGLGTWHLDRLFRRDAQSFLVQLTAKQRPAQVLPCMIYYPCESGSSWADKLFNVLGYNRNPGKLQAIIRLAYRRFTRRIKVPGTTVTPVPLFEVLDSKDPNDYDNRVEPAIQGGEKMGRYFVQAILGRKH